MFCFIAVGEMVNFSNRFNLEGGKRNQKVKKLAPAENEILPPLKVGFEAVDRQATMATHPSQLID